MKKLLSIKSISFIALLFLGISCQKDYEKEYNWAYPISGEWTVTVAAGEDVLGSMFMKTYNTAFGRDSIWVDDNGNFWPFKVKAKVDMTGLTFESTNYLINAGSNLQDVATIRNAKVIDKDSIFFEIEFESETGNPYTISGHRRLSYEEYNGQLE